MRYNMIGTSEAAVVALSAYIPLQRCDIMDAAEGPLDLQPFQTIPSLEELMLQSGTFKNVCITPKLTCLFVMRAEVMFAQDSGLVSELQDLQLHESSLHDIHTVGLAACRDLRSLSVADCWITALNIEDVLDIAIGHEAPLHLLVRMSALTQLSYLCIVLAAHGLMSVGSTH